MAKKIVQPSKKEEKLLWLNSKCRPKPREKTLNGKFVTLCSFGFCIVFNRIQWNIFFHLSTHFQVKNLWFSLSRSRYGNDNTKKKLCSINQNEFMQTTQSSSKRCCARIDKWAKKIYGRKQNWRKKGNNFIQRRSMNKQTVWHDRVKWTSQRQQQEQENER